MLVRTRPFNVRFRPWAFDRTFADLADSFFTSSLVTTPVVSSNWEDGSLKLTVDLPGIPRDAVDVSVAGRALTVAVKTDTLSWQRTVTLGAGLDPEKVSAQYADGRLTVVVGSVAEAQPRRIEIEAVTASAPAIEAGEAEVAQPEGADNGTSATA